jgi:DNA-binding MarR family transcriptional regulator
LEKKIDSYDERKTVIVLTESGKKAIAALRNGEMKLYEEIASGLSLNSKKDKAIYHAALKRGIDHFGKLLRQDEG